MGGEEEDDRRVEMIEVYVHMCGNVVIKLMIVYNNTCSYKYF